MKQTTNSTSLQAEGPCTIGEYRKKFEISQGLCGSPRTDLENLPETPDDSRQHSGPTFSHR